MNLQNPNINDGEKYNHSTISPALKQSARDNGPFFSVVIPVYNEQESLRELHLRLTAVLQELKGSYEIIFVDDGSADGSFTILEDLHKKDHRVIVLQFSRNFGHHLAITAGMDAAVGEVVILMDADLEDQPEEIPALFNKLQEGYDVVYGIRTTRQHTLFKRVSSRLFFALMRRMVKGFDLNSGVFRIARRQVIDTVKRVSGVDFKVEFAGRRAGDPARIVAASDRIRSALAWRPQFDDLQTIVGHALAWERKLGTRNR